MALIAPIGDPSLEGPLGRAVTNLEATSDARIPARLPSTHLLRRPRASLRPHPPGACPPLPRMQFQLCGDGSLLPALQDRHARMAIRVDSGVPPHSCGQPPSGRTAKQPPARVAVSLSGRTRESRRAADSVPRQNTVFPLAREVRVGRGSRGVRATHPIARSVASASSRNRSCPTEMNNPSDSAQSVSPSCSVAVVKIFLPSTRSTRPWKMRSLCRGVGRR